MISSRQVSRHGSLPAGRRSLLLIDEADRADISRFMVILVTVPLLAVWLTSEFGADVALVVGLAYIHITLDWWRGGRP